MKSARQGAILELISAKSIETQEELAEELRRNGYQVTQATVSRDIKELRLVKVLTPEKNYRYAQSGKEESNLFERYARMLADTVVSVSSAYNQIVIHTISASANIAAEAIDSMQWPEILGTIAGENTIFMIVRSVEEVEGVKQRLSGMLTRNEVRKQ